MPEEEGEMSHKNKMTQALKRELIFNLSFYQRVSYRILLDRTIEELLSLNEIAELYSTKQDTGRPRCYRKGVMV